MKTAGTKVKREMALEDYFDDISPSNVDDADREDNSEVLEHKGKYLVTEKALMAKLKSCHGCGKGKTCKVNRFGTHTELNFNQIRAWVCAMVRPPNYYTIYYN